MSVSVIGSVSVHISLFSVQYLGAFLVGLQILMSEILNKSVMKINRSLINRVVALHEEPLSLTKYCTHSEDIYYGEIWICWL